GAVLLRKASDQLGLTAGLSAALLKKGTSPLLDRGTVLVSLAVAIALGATSMSDIALLAHLSPVLGAAPSGPTVRRALDLARSPPGSGGPSWSASMGPAPATISSGTFCPCPPRGRKCCSPAAGPSWTPTRTPSARSPQQHGSPASPRTARQRTTRTWPRSPA